MPFFAAGKSVSTLCKQHNVNYAADAFLDEKHNVNYVFEPMFASAFFENIMSIMSRSPFRAAFFIACFT